MHITYISLYKLSTSFESVYNMYYMVNLPSCNIRIHLVDVLEAHCYVEYKVGLVNFEHHTYNICIIRIYTCDRIIPSVYSI